MQPTVEIQSVLSGFDYLVFSVVVLATIGAVVYGHLRKRSDSSDTFLDHLLMGRQLTLPLFVATLVATWYGGIFGVTEIAFDYGIYNFITQGFFWYLSYIVFALFLAEKVHASEAVTLPELVGNMFGPVSGKLAAVFNFFNVVPIAYAMSLGILANAMFGVSVISGTLIGTLFVCVYSMFGGFRSVVFSDLVQFVVMCSSVVIVLALSISTFGGLDFLQSSLPARYFDPTGGNSWSKLAVWGIIAFSTLVDPNFYQRCFAASSGGTAKKGILLSTVVWCLFDLCTTFGAMYAKANIPEADSANSYLIYAIQLLPEGMRGFFLAGILCTILSTLDSYIFVASNTVSYDLMPESHRKKLWLSKLGILSVGILACFMSLWFSGSIKSVWKTLGSYSAGCLLVPVMIGYVLPGKVSDRSFVIGSISGVIGISIWRNISREGFWKDFDDLYVGVILSAVGILAGLVLDRASKKGVT